MRVEFIIDELVLHGFDARDRHRVADAIAAELEARGTRAAVNALGRGDPAASPGAPQPARTTQAIAASVVDGILGAIARRES